MFLPRHSDRGGHLAPELPSETAPAALTYALRTPWFLGLLDVAEVALLFASFSSSALTGNSLPVSHGWFMQRKAQNS